jgi:hypothetical protein
MADQKISELVAATSAASADLFNIVQGGSNKKLTVANFLANINSPVVINALGANQDTRIAGDTDANLVFVKADNNRVGFGTNSPSAKVDVNGNLAVSGGFLRLSQAPQTISFTSSGSEILNTTSAITLVETEAQGTLVLADGVEGQIKTIIVTSATLGATVTLAPASTETDFYSTIEFASVGASATLQFISGKWWIIASHSVTLD